MTGEELKQLVDHIRELQNELDNVEVKSARRGTVRRLYEPPSAFANRTGGGVILFGLDEYENFVLVKKLCDGDRLKPEGKGNGCPHVLP